MYPNSCLAMNSDIPAYPFDATEGVMLTANCEGGDMVGLHYDGRAMIFIDSDFALGMN
jgi:hypothetical protein